MSGFVASLPIVILSFLFVLSFVVVVHELGHYWAGRIFNMAIDKFSIGFGPALASWTDKRGVVWQVSALPLGGYVRFSGDENAASVPDQHDLADLRDKIEQTEGAAAVSRYHQFKPLWQRAIVAAAGPFANFILAIVLFAVLALIFGVPNYEPRIKISEPAGPAAAAGLRDGDLIRRLDAEEIRDFGDIRRHIQMRPNAPVQVEVLRDGQIVQMTAQPVLTEINDRVYGRVKVGLLGVGIHKDAKVTLQKFNPIDAAGYGVKTTWSILTTTVTYLGRVVTGKIPADQLGSFLGIANTAGNAAKIGAEGARNAGEATIGAGYALLQIVAILSVSVGFLNLLPLPVLDGGHLLFYGYEAVARRPLPARIQAAGYRLGLALLVSFMLFATWNDLQRLRVFNFLGGLFS